MGRLMTGAVMLLVALGAVSLCGVPAAAAPDAVVNGYRMEFRLVSAENGICRVSKSVSVFNPAGAGAAAFLLQTDSFSTLSSFSAKIYSNGRMVKKLKADDLEYTEVTSSLADDIGTYYFSPSLPCPYTVDYEYSVSYRKGVAVFPVFAPVSDPGTALTDATYELSVPAGTEVSWWSDDEPDFSSSGGNDIYIWKMWPWPGFTVEEMMPDIRSVIPLVYSCPVSFSYSGTAGSQRTWADFGRWLYGLNEGTTDLDGVFRAGLAGMVSDCDTDIEKIRVMYDYLRRNTRYVSIQMGIGGYRPESAEYVRKTGFGDCKSLTVFMQALLQAVGITSDYAVTNTSEERLLDGYSSVGQMNHALLCVPSGQDTLWIECTAPSLPLGYRHDGIAGHEAVLVKKEGGVPVVIRGYDDADRIFSQSACVSLKADGKASCMVRRNVTGDFVEDYIGFAEYSEDIRRKILTSGIGFNPVSFNMVSSGNNFSELVDPDAVPSVNLEYVIETGAYAKVSGSRIFVPLDPFAKSMRYSRAERKNPVHIAKGSVYCDSVRVALPHGYRVEGLAEYEPVVSPFGTFETSVSVLSQDGLGDEVLVVRKLKINAADSPAGSYPEYRDFAKAVSERSGDFFVIVSDAASD